MSEESTSGSNSNSSRGGRAILGFDSSDGSGDKNGPCWCFLGFIVITAAVTGGVVSSWPPADPSKSYTDRTVREAIVSDVPTSTVYLDYQYHPRQMVERRQHYSMNSTEDVISIVPLSHNMELASYCYTQNEHAMRCDLYFNNPDNFEYWKDDNQCLSYTIGAPKTTSKNNQCSFFPDDTDDVGKTPPCIKPNQIPLNICSQKISWDNTTCFNRKDTELFSGIIALEKFFIRVTLMVSLSIQVKLTWLTHDIQILLFSKLLKWLRLKIILFYRSSFWDVPSLRFFPICAPKMMKLMGKIK